VLYLKQNIKISIIPTNQHLILNTTQKIKSTFSLFFPKPKAQKTQEKTNNTTKNRIDIYRKVYREITWQQLLKKLLVAIKVPFIAAKHQFMTKAKSSIQNYFSTRPFPWFRLALVLLFLYAFFQKDLQFNINLGGPNTLSEETTDASSKLMVGGFSQTVKHTSPIITGVTLDDGAVKAYINRFKKVSVVEMNKFDIPASIKMGQALLASHAGTNSLANQYNNHFAITCVDGANCESFQIGNQSAMVKTYQSAWESWRNHSQLLSTSKYAPLKAYKKNYKKWAKGLEAAGFSQANNYSQQLIQIIEKYQLYQLDY